jgi:hypothetical protein
MKRESSTPSDGEQRRPEGDLKAVPRGKMQLPGIEQREIPLQRIAGWRKAQREAVGEGNDHHDEGRQHQKQNRQRSEEPHHKAEAERAEIQ